MTSLATGNGGQGPLVTPTPYVGVAPHASIVFARIFTDGTDNVVNANLVSGVQFLFDRADFMQKPIAVNLSLGSDFGPHDGTAAWEQAIAGFVGPSFPGHALVAAAGNSGDVTSVPVHQSVRVSPGSTMTVPILTQGSQNGALEVWIAMRSGATISVGLNGPDGEWISPVSDGSEAGKNTAGYNAGVINGSTAAQSPIPDGSQGAVAVVSGAWPGGTYAITLEGEGTADLYLEGTNDVSIGGNTGFPSPVREGTINLPATNPGHHRRRLHDRTGSSGRASTGRPSRSRSRSSTPRGGSRSSARTASSCRARSRPAKSAGSRAPGPTLTESRSRRSPRRGGSSSAR